MPEGLTHSARVFQGGTSMYFQVLLSTSIGLEWSAVGCKSMQVQWRLCQSSRVAYTQCQVCQGGASLSHVSQYTTLSHGASLSLATLLTITTGQFCLNEDRDDDKAILRYSFCPKGLLARSRAPHTPSAIYQSALGEMHLGVGRWGVGVGKLELGSWVGRKQLELNSSTLLLSTPSLDYESLR